MNNKDFNAKQIGDRKTILFDILYTKGLSKNLITLILDIINIKYQYKIKTVNNFPKLDDFKTLVISDKVMIAEELNFKINLSKKYIFIKRG